MLYVGRVILGFGVGFAIQVRSDSADGALQDTPGLINNSALV